MELLIGCGSRNIRRIHVNGKTEWTELVTLDNNADHKPDVVWNIIPEGQLPFENDTFDEIHAYDVLEHLTHQGDYRAYFALWSEFYRILKPGGIIAAISPDRSSPWAWGDPSHVCIYSPECLIFLNQQAYKEQVGVTPMSDFRYIYKADFQLIHSNVDEMKQFYYALAAIKPSRFEKAV